MPIPFLIYGAATLASIAAPYIIDYFMDSGGGDNSNDIEVVPEVPEQLSPPEMEQALRDDEVVTELVKYYHVPQSAINKYRDGITKLTSEMNEHQRIANKAMDRKTIALNHVNDQVVGLQRQAMQDSIASLQRDEDKAIRKVNDLTTQIAQQQDKLNELYDIQNRPVNDANDLAALQTMQHTGVPIETRVETPQYVTTKVAKTNETGKNKQRA